MHSFRKNQQSGFTLVELMVSISIVALLLVVLLEITNQTSKTWRYTTGKIEQFREARMGFETMTRRISQATLNAYWDYQYKDSSRTVPIRYTRQSELRFVCGNMCSPTSSGAGVNAVLDASPPPNAIRPTHGVFFQGLFGYQAPNGPNANSDLTYQQIKGLDNLLNNWGYYVELNDDYNIGARPPIFNQTFPPLRVRCRLMELFQPANPAAGQISIYDETLPDEQNIQVVNGSASNASNFKWFGESIDISQPPSGSVTVPYHVLAENVIALVVLPKLSQQELNTSASAAALPPYALAPNYYYNSATTGQSSTNRLLNSFNQLPPVVQVTMVAIDEASASRLMSNAQFAKDLLGKLHLLPASQGGSDPLFLNASNFSKDLEQTDAATGKINVNALETLLIQNKIGYRIFTTTVSIRGAKWSQGQQY